MNKKLILAVIPLLVLGGVYKFVLAKPKAEAKPPKVEGTVYVLGKEFLVNLADGRFAKMSVALVLDPKDHSTAAAGGHEGGATPPEGYGAMAQEGVVRTFEGSGVNGKRMSTQGFGSEMPAASNATAAGRSRNRRVVAVLSRMYQAGATSRRTP